jgi:catechol 2,3-dioxygenase-like lactoylglutathione lyase family enzyme
MAGVIDVRAAHHTSFTVSDLERSLHFYRDLLGLEVVVDQTPNASYLSSIVGYPDLHLRIAYLRLPGQSDHRLELIHYLNNVGTPVDLSTNRVGSAHLCLVVGDIFAAFEELRRHGLRFRSHAPVLITAGANVGAYAAYLLDPDGISLELFQPAPRT